MARGVVIWHRLPCIYLPSMRSALETNMGVKPGTWPSAASRPAHRTRITLCLSVCEGFETQVYSFSVSAVTNPPCLSDFKTTQIYYHEGAEVRSPARISLGQNQGVSRGVFLLEASEENSFLCLFQLQETVPVLGLWPLSPSSLSRTGLNFPGLQ